MSTEKPNPADQAPAEAHGDERAAFEAWARDATEFHTILNADSIVRRLPSGNYEYGGVQTAWGAWQTRAALAAAPCGHPASLTLTSAETGEPLYCEACDDKSGRHDAEQREQDLLEAYQSLRDMLDDARAALMAWVQSALSTPPREAAGAVPDGHVVVPVGLIRRAQQAINWHLEPTSPAEHQRTMLELSAIGWPGSAMLAASPSAPSGSDGA